jgi:Na+/melibiose symporter and related transporters
MNYFKRKIKAFFAHNPDYDVQNKELIDFAIGVAGQNHTYNLKSSALEWFCTMALGIDFKITGFMLAIAQVWDGINDPIAGVYIDKHVSMNGEKLRPYIKKLSMPIGIFAMLMFIKWGFTSVAAKVAYVSAIYLIWDTLYTFQDIAQWGFVARISNQPERRAAAAYWGRIGGMVGGLLPGLILTFAGFIVDGVISFPIWAYFLIVGFFFGIGGMALSMNLLKCKERAPAKVVEGSGFKDLKILFKNKIVMWLTLANILGSITFVLQDVYFFQFMMKVSVGGRELGMSLLLAWGIVTGLPGTIAMLFTPTIARKIGGMKRLLVIATVTNIVCRIIAYIVGYQGFGLYIVAFMMMLIGIPNSMTGIASTTLWADSLDYIEWKTGQRNEGAVFACQNLIAKITTGFRVLMSGITMALLKMDAEYLSMCVEKGETPVLSPEFIKYSWPIFILGPALGSVFFLFPLLMMRYSNEEREMVNRELKERHAAQELAEAKQLTADGLTG